MRPPTGDRASGRERELTAYLVVGDLDAARRIAARCVTDTGLAELLLREPARPDGSTPAQGAVLPPREIAFWWWLRGLPARDRVALAMAMRHGWAYDDAVAVLLDEASAVLGRPPNEAPASVTSALERRLGALPQQPAMVRSGRARRARRYAAGALAASLLLAAAAATALAGAWPPPVPAEPPPAQLLPRPLARPIANYEDLAVVPGGQWDLPDRGGRRSAPPWTR